MVEYAGWSLAFMISGGRGSCRHRIVMALDLVAARSISIPKSAQILFMLALERNGRCDPVSSYRTAPVGGILFETCADLRERQCAGRTNEPSRFTSPMRPRKQGGGRWSAGINRD